MDWKDRESHAAAKQTYGLPKDLTTDVCLYQIRMEPAGVIDLLGKDVAWWLKRLSRRGMIR
ncbi:MAG: hypothetical protein ACI9G1_005135 [Pirellulaceae bacterium]|jgi:hypothetical protein